MKFPCLFIWSLLFCSSISLLAQKESNNWIFGANAGINFSTGSPALLPGGLITPLEGCASVSDKSGNLLFYTQGEAAYNSAGGIIQGAVGLLGNNTSAQTAIIVPSPGNVKQYYIFTVPAVDDAPGNGLCYSLIDMTTPSGALVPETKNTFLYGPVCEKLIAVKDNSGCGVWVISHKWKSNEYYAYKVDQTGVNPVPVISAVGITITTTTLLGLPTNGMGQMKASPDGSKIANVHFETPGFYLLDFNTTTGVLSNERTIGYSWPRGYGIEFSPDGNKLYLSHKNLTTGKGNIIQFDLTAPTISLSAVVIGTSASPNLGSLQIAPDNKIYVARGASSNYIGVINNPNTIGMGCSYLDDGFNLWTACNNGLPQKVQTVAINPFASASPNVSICKGQNTVLSASGGNSYLWSPSTGLNSPSGNILTANPPVTTTYTVLIENNGCWDTATVVLTVNQMPSISITGNTTICKGNNITLTAGGGSCSWSTGSNNTFITVAPIVNSVYSVTVSNGNCSDTASVAISVFTAQAFAQTDTAICEGASVPLIASGGSNFLWSTGEQSANITVSPVITTLYSVTVTTGSCEASATVTVTVNAIPIVTTSGNMTINNGESVSMSAGSSGTYLWSPSTGLDCGTCANVIASPLLTTMYCVEVTNTNGCKNQSCLTITIDSVCKNLFIPTVFSPNNDGENDFWSVEGDCITTFDLVVYDRWGNEMFATKDASVKWDGKYKGKELDASVLIYKLKVATSSGSSLNKNGNITLMR